MKVTRNPIGGVGKLSSPGKINEFSFFIRPSFLRILWSWLEILDLSHPEISIFSTDALDLAAVCLVSFVRGGMELSLVDKVDGRRHERKEMEIGNGDGRERIGARRSERDNRRRKKVIYSGLSQNVAPLDGIRVDLMIYTWLKG